MSLESKNLLLIFTRNPELGKCKTRLAATVGDQTALDIYTFLLEHTVSITQNLAVDKQVHYSVKVRSNDLWSEDTYHKLRQEGDDLGIRMENAFKNGFAQGYENIIIIGSDMYDLSQKDLEQAFEALYAHDYVVGPALDGGYYLLGMKKIHTNIFKNKVWGTSTVLEDTLKDLHGFSVKKLEERNDIDFYEDLKDIPAFRQFLTPINL